MEMICLLDMHVPNTESENINERNRMPGFGCRAHGSHKRNGKLDEETALPNCFHMQKKPQMQTNEENSCYASFATTSTIYRKLLGIR